MSVIIDMEMQESCYECPLCNGERCILHEIGYRSWPEEYAHCPLRHADVVPVAKIEKLIESLQEQADLYNARAKELLVEEDGQVSQYTWAVSLRETYRRIIRDLDDLIS